MDWVTPYLGIFWTALTINSLRRENQKRLHCRQKRYSPSEETTSFLISTSLFTVFSPSFFFFSFFSFFPFFLLFFSSFPLPPISFLQQKGTLERVIKVSITNTTRLLHELLLLFVTETGEKRFHLAGFASFCFQCAYVLIFANHWNSGRRKVTRWMLTELEYVKRGLPQPDGFWREPNRKIISFGSKQEQKQFPGKPRNTGCSFIYWTRCRKQLGCIKAADNSPFRTLPFSRSPCVSFISSASCVRSMNSPAFMRSSLIRDGPTASRSLWSSLMRSEGLFASETSEWRLILTFFKNLCSFGHQ